VTKRAGMGAAQGRGGSNGGSFLGQSLGVQQQLPVGGVLAALLGADLDESGQTGCGEWKSADGAVVRVQAVEVKGS
jgi:hypothetical protein